MHEKLSSTSVIDKRRTPAGAKKSNFVLREPGFVPPFEKVTSVCAVVFTSEGELVAHSGKRGPDFPGGHVAVAERTCNATARRESLEEAGVRLGRLKFVRAIESDFYGKGDDDLTYMVVMTGLATEFLDTPLDEGYRIILSVDEFLRQHVALSAEHVKTLVFEAKARWRIFRS